MLGADRFFFATDFPMWDARGELERFNKLDLTAEMRDAILYKNALRLLKEE
jgi:predicted TIM-barrel fold metal-dependent hydrolase